MNTLHQYVRLEDHLEHQSLAQGTVSVLITHSNLRQEWPEIRVDLHTTVGALKDRLYRHGGTGAGFQKLLLRTVEGEVLCEMNDDNRMLGFFGVSSGMNIHIIDIDPYSFSKDGGLENVDLVQKYIMSDEDYERRDNSLRNYKLKMKAKDPYWTFLAENRREPKNLNPPGPEDVEKFNIGDRCEVQPGARRGVLCWKGPGEDYGIGNGYWVGVRLDEPLGKNNGVAKSGKKLFECPDKHGTFVRPENVEAGDFPEKDIFDELSSDEDEL